MAEFITLGIETSCDDTAVALIADGVHIKSNIVSSQMEAHAKFGGVVPELAARNHLEAIRPVYELALREAGLTIDAVDLVAVSYGPGLVGCLLVGLSFAKGLALGRSIPFIGVNHVEGHIYANILERPEVRPPLVCLTVSGGHTDLLYMERWGDYQVLGRTRDDAAGEAFDKIARLLGLGYPGGPPIDRIAVGAVGDIQFTQFKSLPDTYDFSFSGLKTAVVNRIHQLKQNGAPVDTARIAASFQRAVVDQLTEKLFQAVADLNVPTVLLSGGVAANSLLRKRCQAEAERLGKKIYFPEIVLCTDNAAMIAAAGYQRFRETGPSSLAVTAQPDLRL
jgi:N6-L-threonylcarbamoyladenine synthase